MQSRLRRSAESVEWLPLASPGADGVTRNSNWLWLDASIRPRSSKHIASHEPSLPRTEREAERDAEGRKWGYCAASSGGSVRPCSRSTVAGESVPSW
ncbi:MAG: hypothetical protein RLZZ399_407 [Verrucomicrobiota bacterium]|jgi:hypothetical protein